MRACKHEKFVSKSDFSIFSFHPYSLLGAKRSKEMWKMDFRFSVFFGKKHVQTELLEKTLNMMVPSDSKNLKVEQDPLEM